MKLRKTAGRRPSRLTLERLEDRTLLSSSIVESFEPGSLAAYQAAIRNNPGYNLTAQILPIAAHDNSNGLVKQDDYDWLVRNDPGSQVHQGDTLSVWVKLANVADGRAYLGFDAKNTAPAHSPLSQSGALSVVLAPNTSQLLIETSSGANGIANFSTTASVSQTYQADHWYRLEATWGTDGTVTGRLYDSDGVTLLSTVSHAVTAPFPSGGGIAFRAFGHDKYFDTVVLDSGSTDTPAQRVAVDPGLDPGWQPGNPPAPVANGPTGGPAPVPWQYTNTPGTGIEIQLAEFDQLQQGSIVNGVVGLAATNNSLNTGTVQVGWGEPLETPLLAQYIFRELPGDLTRLVGASSVKHFFSSAKADSQHLNPTENDTYGSGLNLVQTYYTDGSELDPVTGTLHTEIDRGTLSADGMVNLGSRAFSSPIQELLQVNVADLDPAQNPAGTRWFLMGNLFVDGEQDVTQASRWVEFVPHYNGTTFTFTYPNGSTGQLNFRTIPNLALPAAGPYVASSSPSGNTLSAVDHVRVTFDRAIDASTFTLGSVDSFTRTVGSTVTDLSGSLLGVTPVGTDGKTFDVSFQSQTTLGQYRLTIGPNVLDLSGNPMDQNQNGVAGENPADDFTAAFTLQGLKVVGATVNGNLPGQITDLRVTFNEPVNLSASVHGEFTLVGPDGSHRPTGVVPVAGSGYTQFDIMFAPLTASGSYSLVLGPHVYDQNGNPMDQDGDLIPGELTDAFTAHGILGGPRVVGLTTDGTAESDGRYAPPVGTVRLTFNEALDPATFGAGQVTLSDPNGTGILVTGVTPVSGGNTQFDVTFAAQSLPGAYTVTVGGGADAFGNPLAPYSGQFTLADFHVAAASPNGSASPGVDHVRLTLDRAVDPATFTTDLVALTGPGGSGVAVTGVVVVPGSNNTQFDVTFAALTTPGAAYQLAVAGLNDAFGNPLTAYVDNFHLGPPVYTASSTTFQSNEIFGQAGTQTLTFTSGQVTADDDFGTINLGSNTFNFYGTTYSQLYVSSNGLITFGSGNTAYTPTNLTSGPTQAAIAAYWTDLIKTGTEPMILYQISGNQLIIEWYNVSTYPDGSSSPQTFQAVLQLNTGTQAGDIVLNYDNVTGMGAADDSSGITVGVKDAGTGSTVGHTVVQDGSGGGHGDPRIASGHSVRISAS